MPSIKYLGNWNNLYKNLADVFFCELGGFDTIFQWYAAGDKILQVLTKISLKVVKVWGSVLRWIITLQWSYQGVKGDDGISDGNVLKTVDKRKGNLHRWNLMSGWSNSIYTFFLNQWRVVSRSKQQFLQEFSHNSKDGCLPSVFWIVTEPWRLTQPTQPHTLQGGRGEKLELHEESEQRQNGYKVCVNF